MATLYRMRPVKLVGRKIRQLRKERNLTQTELSNRIGIQQSDLSRMEKGEYRVSLDTLFRILGEFEMSFGEFFDEMARESMSERDVRRISELQALDEETRQEVEALISNKTRSVARATPRESWPATTEGDPG
mgnify:CR=1 FL=1